jgi:hypothetical protein
MMAFASLGTHNKVEQGATFRVMGKLHHNIGSLQPGEGEKPKFAQIYFYDSQDTVHERMSHHKTGLRSSVVKLLEKSIKANNPFYKDFKSALEILPPDIIPEARLVLSADIKKKPTNEHSGRYNLPSGSEVAVLLPGDQAWHMDVVLHCRGGGLQTINQCHRFYDPLHYVLLLPRGEEGWHGGEGNNMTDQNRRNISPTAFYAYHLQTRKDSSPILHFGRLTQQYITDMYAKVSNTVQICS